jgi:hypothetical protein
VQQGIFNIEMRPTAASSFASGENASFDHVCLMFSTKSVQSKEEFLGRAGELDGELLKACDKKLKISSMQAFDMRKQSETKGDHNVQSAHLDPLCALLGFSTTTKDPKNSYSGAQLKNFGANFGAATEISSPDAFVEGAVLLLNGTTLSHVLRALGEAKSTAACATEGLRQAVSEAVNVGFKLLRLGVLAADIFVPVFSLTGELAKFGVVDFIPPALPRFQAISKTLDLSDTEDRQEAARCLVAIKVFCQTPLKASKPEDDKRDLQYSTVNVHFKNINTEFFSGSADVNQALLRMLGVLNLIRSDGEASSVSCLPISIMSCRGNDGNAGGKLVFKNLATETYRIGLPDDARLRRTLLVEFQAAARKIHSAGVVHLDFYPSNIMWKVQNDSVQVKIIDWDSVCEKDQPMPIHLVERLQSEAQQYRCDLLSSVDMKKVSVEWDLSLLVVLEASLDDPSLQTSDKQQLDAAFQKLCEDHKVQEQMDRLSFGSNSTSPTNRPATPLAHH